MCFISDIDWSLFVYKVLVSIKNILLKQLGQGFHHECGGVMYM